MDKFKSMKVFVSCLEKGSFSSAAVDLDMTPQNVAKVISELEKDLGVRLLTRTTRSQSPTEAGKIYFDKCRRILEDVSESETILENFQKEIKGTVKFSVPSTFGIFLLSRKLPDWLRKNSNVSVDLTVTDQYPQIVENGLDLAIFQGDIPESRFISRKIADVRISVAASDFYIRYSEKLATPWDLQNHVCIRRPDQKVWEFIDSDDNLIKVPMSDQYVSDNCQFSCEMAIDGLGITKQPNFRLWPFFERGLLKPVLQDYRIPTKPLWLIYPYKKQKTARVESFIHFVMHCLDGAPSECFENISRRL